MGCSNSKTSTMTVKPIEDESHGKLTTTTNPTASTRIVEDFILFWFLPDGSMDVENEKAKLRHVISTVKIFSDENEFLTAVKNVQVEKLFLIVCSIDSSLDSIRKLPQLEKIYRLDRSFREVEKKIESIIRSDTFYDIDSLCQQLENDVELCSLDRIPMSSSISPLIDESSLMSNSKQEEAAFLFSQLMREILYRLKFENNAKNEFVQFCRSHYTENNEQLRMIDEFQTNYRPQKALFWLTRRCFICRILQRMQRTMEIDILYKIGFLVKHAHIQLTIFQENNFTNNESLSIVYRGKTMFTEKFQMLIKNNVAGLICFANFFIGHYEKEIALDFLHRRLTALPEATGILFQIHVQSNIHNARSPWATLDKVFGDEKMEKNGIFFGMYAVFRIDLVDQFIDELMNIIWMVKLTLIADDDPQLLRLVAPLRSSEVHANPISFLGKIFMEMGEYKRAEQFFLRMLQDASVRSQPRRLVRVHIGLGANYFNSGDFVRALDQYQQALQVSLTYLPPTHTDLAPLYDSIGKSFFHQGQYEKAVENYERATDLIGQNTQARNDQLVNEINIQIDSAKKMLNRQT